jgi:hypothetical protein
MKKTSFSIAMLIAMCCAAPAFAKGGVAGGGGRAVSVSPARASVPVSRPAPAPVAAPAPASTSKVLSPSEASAIRARNAQSTTPSVATNPAVFPATRSGGSSKKECTDQQVARNECKR